MDEDLVNIISNSQIYPAVMHKVLYKRRWFNVISTSEETMSELKFPKFSQLKVGRKRYYHLLE